MKLYDVEKIFYILEKEKATKNLVRLEASELIDLFNYIFEKTEKPTCPVCSLDRYRNALRDYVTKGLKYYKDMKHRDLLEEFKARKEEVKEKDEEVKKEEVIVEKPKRRKKGKEYEEGINKE